MRRALRRRGAAAVEMAVTMVLLIPLIMYTLFLEDLLVYKLEQQEPTIAAGWDYAVVDYQEGKGLGRVPNMNQLKYCDHSAAFDSYDKTFDCNTDGIHHEAGTAHQCWLVPGAKQLACSNSTAVGRNELLPMGQEFQTWHAQFNRGGMARCSASLGVMNYFLPNKFFEWASQREVTKKTKLGGDQAKIDSANVTVHSEAGGTDQTDADESLPPPPPGPGSNPGAWVLKEEVFAVMNDPWALNDIQETSPGSVQMGHPFYERASVYFDGAGGGMMAQGNSDAKQYQQDLKELIGDNAARDLMGDDPSTLPLLWKKEKTRSENGGYASGYEDSRMASSQSRTGGNEFPRAWGPP